MNHAIPVMNGSSALAANAASAASVREVGLNEEQRRSQISGGHRLIRLVSQKRFQLYFQEEFANKARYVSADYWLDSFVPSLRVRMNSAIAARVNAAIARARAQSAAYEVKTPGIAECVAEAFFDNWWFKVRERNFSRRALRDKIRPILERGETLQLLFPVLSRKPLSPIKNRGVMPDVSELHSLARLAEATQVINALSPTGCQLTILADGLKYNRACLTPNKIVAGYQNALRFWLDRLNVTDIITLENYEDWVERQIPGANLSHRKTTYEEYCRFIDEKYSKNFHAEDLETSMSRISTDDIGQQLRYTFWSIVASTYYDELYKFTGGRSFSDLHYGDEAQRLYVSYVSSLHRPLSRQANHDRRLLSFGYIDPRHFTDLFCQMREQAWRAAVRYVAISLTDRDLNVLRKISPAAIKLTIHGKKDELHFVSATQRDAAMTAQHSTGGFSLEANGSYTVTFRYRLEREACGESPILIERIADTPENRRHYGPLWQLQEEDQPFAYVDETAKHHLGSLHYQVNRKA